MIFECKRTYFTHTREAIYLSKMLSVPYLGDTSTIPLISIESIGIILTFHKIVTHIS